MDYDIFTYFLFKMAVIDFKVVDAGLWTRGCMGFTLGAGDCWKMCIKWSFIDRITGLTGYEYDNILSIL